MLGEDCVPPWMTDNEKIWCQENLNISRERSEKMRLHFDKIIDGKAIHKECPTPCRRTRFDHHFILLFSLHNLEATL